MVSFTGIVCLISVVVTSVFFSSLLASPQLTRDGMSMVEILFGLESCLVVIFNTPALRRSAATHCGATPTTPAPQRLLMLNPFVVKVSYSPIVPGQEPIRCTGAIYNKLWIVTSARCAIPTLRMLNNKPYHDFGDINMDEDEPRDKCKPADISTVRYLVDAAVQEPTKRAMLANASFDENELAMVKINKPLLYSKVLKAIRIPSSAKDCEQTDAAILAFSTVPESDKLSHSERILRKINVTQLTEAECLKADPKLNVSTSFCTKTNGKDQTCDSDLGAPLVKMVKVKLKQAPVPVIYPFLCGVLTKTFCEDEGRPAGVEIFTETYKYQKWMQKIAGQQDKFD